jgi:ABC-2 type transport system ATP-binding protein
MCPNPLPLRESLAAAGHEALEKRKFGELSGGRKQRVLFALALCGNPDLLFLDEPTTGLDVEARRIFWNEIQRRARQGKTILLTTHYMEEADALADRVVVLNQGAIIAEGTPAQIKTRAAGRRIRCVTRLSVEEVRRLPGVLDASRAEESVEYPQTEADPNRARRGSGHGARGARGARCAA